jgi:hypothetical protein
MARVVLKYLIENSNIPEDHKFLHAATQGANAYMWLEVNTASREIPSPYKMFPTGFSEVPQGTHQATFISDWNKNVWHVYKL